MESNIYLEIFGYFGTALVIVSMMMSSIARLRIINMCGGLVSLVYAALVGALPVVLLNLSLITINFIQTVRYFKAKRDFTAIKTNVADDTVGYFLSVYEKDITAIYGKALPNIRDGSDVYIIFKKSEIAGILIGRESEYSFAPSLFYTLPHHTERHIGEFIVAELSRKNKSLTDLYLLRAKRFFTTA